MFFDTLPICLDAGITEWEFWNMTYGEIVNVIKTYNKRYVREQKEKALLTYRLADLIAAGVGMLFDKDAKMPQIYEAFPGLFEEEKVKLQQAENERENQLYKARFIAFAESHNVRWGEMNR